MERDAAVRRHARLAILTRGGRSAMGMTVMTPGALSAKRAVIGRTPACMHGPHQVVADELAANLPKNWGNTSNLSDILVRM